MDPRVRLWRPEDDGLYNLTCAINPSHRRVAAPLGWGPENERHVFDFPVMQSSGFQLPAWLTPPLE